MGRNRKDGTNAAAAGESKPEAGNIVTPKTEGSGPDLSGTPAPLTQRDTAAGVKTKYVSLKVGEDGAFDLSKMKPKSKEELRDAFVKTSRKGELGPVAVPDTFSPESMLGYVSLLFGIESAIVVKAKLATPDVAAEVFRTADSQGRPVPELMAVATPAAKVANKYLADFKYADEMALIGAVVELTFAKIVLCQHLMKLCQATEPRPGSVKPNGHADAVGIGEVEPA